jgi:hypothetical protein
LYNLLQLQILLRQLFLQLEELHMSIVQNPSVIPLYSDSPIGYYNPQSGSIIPYNHHPTGVLNTAHMMRPCPGRWPIALARSSLRHFASSAESQSVEKSVEELSEVMGGPLNHSFE